MRRLAALVVAAAAALAAAASIAILAVAPQEARAALFGGAPAILFLLLGWETLAPCLPLFRRARNERARHGLHNLTLAAGNAVATALLFTGLWWSAAFWSARHDVGILQAVGLPPAARALAAVAVLDAWAYGWHRLNHRIPLLWRFHRTHHSDPRMDVTTAGRFHVGEILTTNAARIPLIVLAGLTPWEVVLYQALLTAVAQFHHANVRLPRACDRALRVVIVTPAMHRVHHSRWQPETDSNFASLFSVWDRLFRSFRLHDDPATLRFGLDGFDGEERQTLAGLLATPLNAARSAERREASRRRAA